MLVCSSLSCGLVVCAEEANFESGMSISVSNVKTGLVGDSLVRAIQHNMEINPIIQFEIISRPIIDVLDFITIKDIPFSGETLSFENSSGAYVEGIYFKENSVEFEFDYFYSDGGSVSITCTIPVRDNHFFSLDCVEN
jgi:hypothetical protein